MSVNNPVKSFLQLKYSLRVFHSCLTSKIGANVIWRKSSHEGEQSKATTWCTGVTLETNTNTRHHTSLSSINNQTIAKVTIMTVLAMVFLSWTGYNQSLLFGWWLITHHTSSYPRVVKQVNHWSCVSMTAIFCTIFHNLFTFEFAVTKQPCLLLIIHIIFAHRTVASIANFVIAQAERVEKRPNLPIGQYL